VGGQKKWFMAMYNLDYNTYNDLNHLYDRMYGIGFWPALKFNRAD